MNDAAIRVQHCSKRYRIGAKHKHYTRTSEAVMDILLAPFRRLRQLGKPAPPEEVFWALDDVSFEVAPGEVVGIIGRNGAGKSTLLKILSRITAPTRGRVEIFGRIGSLLEVGTGFHPELTGRENIYLNGTLLGMKRREIDQKLDEIVAFSEIEQFLDTPVKHYSSGMYVRLAFAVAAHLEPEILIVDEVLAVGDLAFQKKCLGKMSDVAGAGRTVLFVSHGMAAVKSLCTRAILLNKGKIELIGDTDSVVSAYVGPEEPVPVGGIVPNNIARTGTGTARLRRVALRDNVGKSIDRVFLGQPFQVSAVYEVFQPIPQAVLEIGISNPARQRIASAATFDGGGGPVNLQPGLWEFTAQIDVTLMPGEFALDCCIADWSGLTIDWVDRTIQFIALGITEVGPDAYKWSQSRGYVRPKSSWQGPLIPSS